MALFDLRMTRDEFWRSTPRMTHAINARRVQAQEWEETLHGIVAAAVVNFSQFHPKKTVLPSDFGLGPRKRASAAQLSDQEIADQWRGFFARMGVVKPKQEKPNAERDGSGTADQHRRKHRKAAQRVRQS